jgi:hypothetical protein
MTLTVRQFANTIGMYLINVVVVVRIVLTKVVVYGGIGYGATYLIPMLLRYIDSVTTYVSS